MQEAMKMKSEVKSTGAKKVQEDEAEDFGLSSLYLDKPPNPTAEEHAEVTPEPVARSPGDGNASRLESNETPQAPFSPSAAGSPPMSVPGAATSEASTPTTFLRLLKKKHKKSARKTSSKIIG